MYSSSAAGVVFELDCLLPDVRCWRALSGVDEASGCFLVLSFRSSRSPHNRNSFSRRVSSAFGEARRLKGRRD